MMSPSIDLKNWIKDNLFDVVPMAIAVIDRDFNLVYANRSFEQMFGAWKDRKCFSVYKDRDSLCPNCKGSETFNDGISRTNQEMGYDKNGRLTRYIKNTVPVTDQEGKIVYLLEMATDITESEKIREEYHLLFDQVPCNVLVIDRSFHIVKANKKVRELLGNITGQHCYEMLKEQNHKCTECTAHQTFTDGKIHTGHHIWQSVDGEEIHSLVTTVPLEKEEEQVVSIMEMAVDITQMLKLENEKREAERLAAVGQTVAGLAHGIKNLITGLEGGMYMLNSGISKSNADRLHKGIEMLNRNIERVSTFVKEFLSFSKGRVIRSKPTNPETIAQEVVELYAEKARELGIELTHKASGNISLADMDSESMHECLTNLIGNAMDACRMSDKKNGCYVRVKTFEKDHTIIYEVIDNGCGMDYEIKKKVFTNFFTTKGLGGTGLGLLTTKKIVQEHGGKIEMESEHGKGTTFRILLPRDRLPKPAEYNNE